MAIRFWSEFASIRYVSSCILAIECLPFARLIFVASPVVRTPARLAVVVQVVILHVIILRTSMVIILCAAFPRTAAFPTSCNGPSIVRFLRFIRRDVCASFAGCVFRGLIAALLGREYIGIQDLPDGRCFAGRN